MAVGRSVYKEMNRLRLRTPAKLNLLLDITGKRPDGYHMVRMIMQTIAIHDELLFEKTDGSGVTFRVEDRYSALHGAESPIPADDRNLVLRAVRLLSDTPERFSGLSVTLTKHIPSQAGMGGGSSDAAAALIGLNRLYELGLTEEELAARALMLGADVPFFLKGGTCLAEGVGEQLTMLPALHLPHLLIVKPEAGLSTKLVYETYDSCPPAYHPDTEAFLRALSGTDALSDTFLSTICETMGNVMEEAAFSIAPEVRKVRDLLRTEGASAALMTGSGSAVFGVFRDEETALSARKTIAREMPETCQELTASTEFGVEELPV